MKKLLLFLVFLPLLLSCEGAGELGRAILDETKRCNEYKVYYHSTNKCNGDLISSVYLTPEEFQRLYDIVSNASPPQCVFVTILPKDGSPSKVGYIKDLLSLSKRTLDGGQYCN